jgi:lysophospholipase L1-like esterase
MSSHRLAATLGIAAVRSVGFGALGMSAALGLIAGESALARARIPKPKGEPPTSDGTRWTAPGVPPTRRPLRLAVLGDSLAAGLGAPRAEDTMVARLALQVSARAGRPVQLTNAAVVGSRSRDLRAQVDAVVRARPHVAVIVIGANDVTHRSGTEDAVRLLMLAVHRLQVLGADVVVGTCPDIGTVSAIAEPLRRMARRQARLLADAQAAAVRRAGAHPVDLFTLLGARFRADRAMFAADGFHPSATGYAAAAEVLFPAVCAALGLPDQPELAHAA